MRHECEFCAVKALFAVLRLVPLPVSGWIFERAGDLFYFCSPGRRKIAMDNLSIAYGDALSARQKRRIARKCFQSGALSILELFLIKKMKKGASRRFTITGESHFEGALSRGRGIVFVASHLGSWEYIGYPGYLRGVPRAVIVKKLKNDYLNRTIDGLRREIETLPIPKVNAIRRTLSELRRNHGVAVVIDQWAGSEGIWMNFFGRATSTTSLPARLAQKTGAALIPIYCLRKKIGRYEIRALPEVKIPDGPDWERQTTERLNEILETQIRQTPEQWSWGHKRWKPKPPAIREG
ncbi:MAG: lysophospholipid acyltransferase family protein [Candidatus Omnitrophica bacterium]|nr:lysophospholipid acyltransferase family protein [Candidatus Omnitrophota bacterium]